MKIASLFSGGKDSVFAIYIASQSGWDIKHIVSVYPKRNDSWMFHSVNINLSEIIAEAIDIPFIKTQTNGKKEKELDDLKAILKPLDIDGVISGAIASEYQRTRIEKICHELELKSFTPIWHKDQELILREQIKSGFKIKIVGIFAQGFDKNWLGKIIDEKSLEDLIKLKKKYLINISGEGGEYETLVLDGPIFKKEIILDETLEEWTRDRGILKVNKAHIE
jgi:ABC transporter with metal-binding/Fe-S-binding domain ATP-binding protein